MNESTGNEKENEATSESASEEPKKAPNLDDTLSRLLRTQADVDAEAGEDSAE